MNRIKLWPHATIAISGGCARRRFRRLRLDEVRADRLQLGTCRIRLGYSEWMARSLSAIAARALMGKQNGPPLLRINLSQREIGSTHVITRAPRSLLADAISRGSIQTHRWTWCRLGTAAPSSRCATARPCSTSGIWQPNELFEVATPYGAVNFDQPGLYNVGFDRNGGVLVSVLSGLAQVVGQSGSGEINKGEMLTLLGQTAAEVGFVALESPGCRISGG